MPLKTSPHANHGDPSGNRYTTLTQIDKTNVACLAPRWVFPIPNVTQVENTPVVAGGIMYVSSANEVYALDAGSGRQIWHHRRSRTTGLAGNAAIGFNRGVAISGNRLLGGTNWFSTSFNPATGLYYIQALERCNLFSKRDMEWQAGQGFMGGTARPAPGETFTKSLRAINIQTGDTVWDLPQVTGGRGLRGWPAFAELA